MNLPHIQTTVILLSIILPAANSRGSDFAEFQISEPTSTAETNLLYGSPIIVTGRVHKPITPPVEIESSDGTKSMFLRAKIEVSQVLFAGISAKLNGKIFSFLLDETNERSDELSAWIPAYQSAKTGNLYVPGNFEEKRSGIMVLEYNSAMDAYILRSERQINDVKRIQELLKKRMRLHEKWEAIAARRFIDQTKDTPP